MEKKAFSTVILKSRAMIGACLRGYFNSAFLLSFFPSFLTSCFLFCFHDVQADGKRVVLDAGLKAVSLDSGVPLVCS